MQPKQMVARKYRNMVDVVEDREQDKGPMVIRITTPIGERIVFPQPREEFDRELDELRELNSPFALDASR